MHILRSKFPLLVVITLLLYYIEEHRGFYYAA